MIVGYSAVKHLHGSFKNKTNKDNIILFRRFRGARTKSMKKYATPDVEKIPDLVIIHTGNLKPVSPFEEIANEIISFA